jgi:hypothetical protein
MSISRPCSFRILLLELTRFVSAFRIFVVVAGHLIAFLLDGPCVMMAIFLNPQVN